MLQAKQISRHFQRGTQSVWAVRGVTLELSTGQITAIAGQSGSGKTTLLHLLAGLLTPTEGAVLLDGQDLYQLPDKELSRLRGQKISFIPQGQSALHNLTVLENVLLPYALYPAGEPVADRALALLKELGIENLAAAKPDTLSGGELRRMSVARALFLQPQVILADEPTSDLDEENTTIVMTALKAAASRGAAVLFVTHEPGTLQYAGTVYRMSDGSLFEI